MFRSAFALGLLLCACLFAPAQSHYVDSLLTALGQSEPDSQRVLLLNELSWEYALTDADLSLRFAERATDLATEIGDTAGRATGRYYLGRAHSLLGNYEAAIRETERSLALYAASEDMYGVAKTHNQIGTTYKFLGEYEKAIFHLYESLKGMEALEADYGAAQIKMNIAYFAFEQEDFAQVLEVGKEALETFKKYEDQQMIGVSTELLAMGYQKQGNLNRALALHKVALEIFKEAGEIQREAEVINNMGILYHERQELDEALLYYNKSLALDDSLGNTLSIAKSHANIAMAYADKGEHAQSIAHIDQSIEIGKAIGRLKDVMTTMEYAAQVHYLNKNYKNAYDYRLVYDQIKDTIFSVKRNEQILKIQEEFESERKEKEIVILTKERDAAEAKSLLVDSVILFSIGTFLLLVIIVVIFIKHRKNKEDRQKLELEQKVLRSQMNPHFIFNSLNSIQRLFMQGDEDLANDYIGDFGKLLRIILENSGSSKISIQKEIETLKLYLDIEMVRLDGGIAYEFDIDPHLDQLNNFIPPLILQPFVENAIWHGILPKEGPEKGKIKISIAKESPQMLVCTVEDNGIGVQESLRRKQKGGHVSKGMNITQQRLGTANRIRVEEMETGGTKVTLSIPLDL